MKNWDWGKISSKLWSAENKQTYDLTFKNIRLKLKKKKLVKTLKINKLFLFSFPDQFSKSLLLSAIFLNVWILKFKTRPQKRIYSFIVAFVRSFSLVFSSTPRWPSQSFDSLYESFCSVFMKNTTAFHILYMPSPLLSTSRLWPWWPKIPLAECRGTKKKNHKCFLMQFMRFQGESEQKISFTVKTEL